jgi:hypothetical protein
MASIKPSSARIIASNSLIDMGLYGIVNSLYEASLSIIWNKKSKLMMSAT